MSLRGPLSSLSPACRKRLHQSPVPGGISSFSPAAAPKRTGKMLRFAPTDDVASLDDDYIDDSEEEGEFEPTMVEPIHRSPRATSALILDGVVTPAPEELLSPVSPASIATRPTTNPPGRMMVIAEHDFADYCDRVNIQSPASPLVERLPVVYNAADTTADRSPGSDRSDPGDGMFRPALRAGRHLFGESFNFRTQQEESIEALVDGQSVVALHPTGHGKTLLLMIAARMGKPGVSIVFSPLLALMQDICDRVNALQHGDFKAMYINGEMMGAAKRVVYSELANILEVQDDSRLILLMTAEMYVSSSEMFGVIMKLFAHDCLSMIMTDEVHTVSEQGFGFRPSMLALGDVRRTLPGECRPLCS